MPRRSAKRRLILPDGKSVETNDKNLDLAAEQLKEKAAKEAAKKTAKKPKTKTTQES